jgi:hypothetical protein
MASTTTPSPATAPAAIVLAAVLAAGVLAIVSPVPAALAMGADRAGSGPTTPPVTDPTVFVHRLVGEWSVVTQTVLGPGQEPVVSEGRESARMVGSWLVAESVGDAVGRPFTAILTLGWEPHGERFVATWIDGVQRHLWDALPDLRAPRRVVRVLPGRVPAAGVARTGSV